MNTSTSVDPAASDPTGWKLPAPPIGDEPVSPEHENPSTVDDGRHDGLAGHPKHVMSDPLPVGQLDVS
jgi:hypothetical protein